jgi:transposase
MVKYIPKRVILGNKLVRIPKNSKKLARKRALIKAKIAARKRYIAGYHKHIDIQDFSNGFVHRKTLQIIEAEREIKKLQNGDVSDDQAREIRVLEDINIYMKVIL